MLTPSQPPPPPTFDDTAPTPPPPPPPPRSAPSWWQPVSYTATAAGGQQGTMDAVRTVLEGLNARRMKGDDVTGRHLLELRAACDAAGGSARGVCVCVSVCLPSRCSAACSPPGAASRVCERTP